MISVRQRGTTGLRSGRLIPLQLRGSTRRAAGSTVWACPVVLPLTINNAGQVAGSWQVPGDPRSGSAFIYTPGSGVKLIGSPFTVASDINAHGTVVGRSRTHAFVYTPSGGLVDIQGGSTFNEGNARAINDAGLVVGNWVGESRVDRAFVYSAQRGFVDVGEQWGYSALWDVNNKGVALGDFGTSASDTKPGLYDTKTGLLTFLPMPATWTSSGGSINDAGQVVGAAVDTLIWTTSTSATSMTLTTAKPSGWTRWLTLRNWRNPTLLYQRTCWPIASTIGARYLPAGLALEA